MTICTSCAAARLTSGGWNYFDSPKCLYCSARLIQQIGKIRGQPAEKIAARRRVVLTDAVAWGHDEQVIRRLAKGGELSLLPLVKRK